jgi:hypothetical protein
MKLVSDFKSPVTKDSIICFCVFRDEALLLRYFIDYYSALGVTHFVFIDNGSTDSSAHYINKRSELCARLYYTEDSYSENQFGLTWVNSLLRGDFVGACCLVVDIDEFILPRADQNLISLRESMESGGYNICQTFMVDFYPGSKSRTFHYDPFEHSCYYDTASDHKYYFLSMGPEGSTVIKGGARQRIFNQCAADNESCCLNKKSFFINNFSDSHYLEVGMHWILPHNFTTWDNHPDWNESINTLKFYPKIQCMAHFKFVKPNLREFFKLRLDRNEDWGDSDEYKKYYDNFTDKYYSEAHSQFFNTTKKLYEHTIDMLQQ